MSLHIYRRRLPHWRNTGATYFVTWRLHRTQPPLSSIERTAVFSAVRHHDGSRFRLRALVVMDDHVHLVVTPLTDWPLERLIQTWKSFSARQLRRAGRPAPIWQLEYYDRIVRSTSDLAEKINYVGMNPSRRWPGLIDYPWLWVSEF